MTRPVRIQHDPACYWYRDRDGFCHLVNRCWSGKPCPKTQRQADAARAALVSYYSSLVTHHPSPAKP